MNAKRVAVKLSDLELALMWADGGGEAYIERATGRILQMGADDAELDDPAPDDLDDPDRYLPVPTSHLFDLGQSLILQFVREVMPDDEAAFSAIFSLKGAYRRFKDALYEKDRLDQWHEYEEAARVKALRDWVSDNGLAIEE